MSLSHNFISNIGENVSWEWYSHTICRMQMLSFWLVETFGMQHQFNQKRSRQIKEWQLQNMLWIFYGTRLVRALPYLHRVWIQVCPVYWPWSFADKCRAVKSCQKTNTCKRPIHPFTPYTACNRLTLTYVEHLCCYLWQTLFKGVCHLM